MKGLPILRTIAITGGHVCYIMRDGVEAPLALGMGWGPKGRRQGCWPALADQQKLLLCRFAVVETGLIEVLKDHVDSPLFGVATQAGPCHPGPPPPPGLDFGPGEPTEQQVVRGSGMP
jgi:hypothetical protein